IGLGIGFLLAYVLARRPSVQRLFIALPDRLLQVQRRAQLEFYEAGLMKTDQRTGILIFVSMMEHQAVVLADRSIAEKVDSEEWLGVIEKLLNGIKRGDAKTGFVDAIRRCGD